MLKQKLHSRKFIQYSIMKEKVEVGRMSIEREGAHSAYIYNVVVFPYYRHNGYALEALKELEEKFPNKKLTLISKADELYLKAGFKRKNTKMIFQHS